MVAVPLQRPTSLIWGCRSKTTVHFLYLSLSCTESTKKKFLLRSVIHGPSAVLWLPRSVGRNKMENSNMHLHNPVLVHPPISRGRELPNAANKSCSLFFRREESHVGRRTGRRPKLVRSLSLSGFGRTNGRTVDFGAQLCGRCDVVCMGRHCCVAPIREPSEKPHFAGNKMVSQGREGGGLPGPGQSAVASLSR